jgi:hypothetical protein
MTTLSIRDTEHNSRGLLCQVSIMPSVFMYAECRKLALYAEYRYAECHYAECHDADKWKGSNRKQSARWQHVSHLKASGFFIW